MPGPRGSSVFIAALCQGLVVVSFPASAAVLRTTHGFSDAQYGSIFIPQTILTIVGSLLSGGLSARVGLATLLRVALACGVAAEVLLLATTATTPATAYVAVLAGTGLMGLGFGLASAPLNALPALSFPSRREAALVAVHTAVGAGFAAGPIVSGFFAARGTWELFPAVLAALALALALVPYPDARSATAARDATGTPARSPAFWMLVAAAIVYAIAEGTFANWTVVYLHEERALDTASASLALAVFWVALVAGRLVVSALVLRVPPARVRSVLPVLMIAAFLLLPEIHDRVSALIVFGVAGAACSGFFPLTLGLASSHFPAHTGWTSAMLTASLMLGVGVGSFALGPLRSELSLATLYRWSALGPAALLLLGVLATRLASSSRSSVASSR